MQTETAVRKPIVWHLALLLIFIHLAAVSAFWMFSWSALIVAIVLYAITGGLGISLGLHRMLTHNAFKARPWFGQVLTIAGVLAFQAGPITWVGTHRAHHAYSDTPRDPHDSGRGVWWSHIGWIYHQPREAYDRFAPSRLRESAWCRFLDRHLLVPTAALAAVLFAIGGLPWVMWGIFVRIVVLLHVTLCVNSVAHLFGYVNYALRDTSKNVGTRGPLGWLLNLMSFGEFLHNNHHAQERSAKFNHRAWEFDPMWPCIALFERLGWITDVVRPKAESKTALTT